MATGKKNIKKTSVAKPKTVSAKPVARPKAATTKTVVSKSIVINPKTGLYMKRDSSSGKFISSVTKAEIKKLGPVLKRLADYDKGKKKAR